MRPEVRWPFDPSAVGALVDDAARLHMEARAGRGFRLVSDGPSGPVTTVDLEVQRCLEAELASLAERVRFVGEESEEPWTEVLASNDPDRLCWVLDPLDGTASFLRGENSFGVQLALLRGATVIGAWINCAALGLSAAAWDGAPLVRTAYPTAHPNDSGRRRGGDRCGRLRPGSSVPHRPARGRVGRLAGHGVVRRRLPRTSRRRGGRVGVST